MNAEGAPHQETTRSSKSKVGRLERVELRSSSMSNESYCSLVSKSFPFLQKDDLEKIPNAMHSACTARRKEENASHKLCPVFKFASHAFSASLVQGEMHNVIADIEEIRNIIRDINDTYFSPQKPTPSSMDKSEVWPETKDHKNSIAEFIGRLRNKYCLDNNDELFHLLRINQKIKCLWGSDQLWENLENTASEYMKFFVTLTGQQPSKLLSLALIALVIEQILNTLLSGMSLQPDTVKAFSQFINESVRHFNHVKEMLSRIEENIKREHERAYRKDFSPSVSSWMQPQYIHPGFDKTLNTLAIDTEMWDLHPLEKDSQT